MRTPFIDGGMRECYNGGGGGPAQIREIRVG